MPIISRPKEQVVPFSGKINIDTAANAAASAAAIGREVVNLGKAVGEANVRQIQAIGDAIGSIGGAAGSSRRKAKSAEQQTILSDKLNSANLEFAKQLGPRIQQTTDKDGNPTHESLVDDIGVIGKKLQGQILKTIKDPEVAKQFTRIFNRQITNKQISGIGESRRQQLKFIEDGLHKNVDELVRQGSADDISNIKFYRNRLNELINSATQNGAVTQAQGSSLIEKSIKAITQGQVGNLIKADPNSASQIIKNLKGQDIGIDDQTRLQLLDEANGAISDQKNRDTIQRQEQNQAKIEDQNSLLSELENGVNAGTVGDREILQAKHQNKIDELQATKLMMFKQKVTKTALDKAITNEKISLAISQGKSLNNFNARQINDHYKRAVALRTKENQPLDLKAKAKLVSQYKSPVPLFQKELDGAVSGGDLEATKQAIAAYNFVKRNNPIALQGFNKGQSKDSLAVISMSTVLMTKTNTPEDEAIQRSKAAIFHNDNAVSIDRSKRFSRLPDFKSENIKGENNLKDTIKDMFGSRKVIDDETTLAFHELFKEAYIKTGDVDAAKELVKNEVEPLFGESQFNEQKGFFNDKENLMFLPPEKVFPDIPVDDLKNDLHTSIQQFLPKGHKPEDVIIKSDSLSRLEGQPVSYGIFDKEGNPLTGPDGSQLRWSPVREEILGGPEVQAARRIGESTANIEDAKFQRTLVAETNKRLEDLGTNSAKDPFLAVMTRAEVRRDIQAGKVKITADTPPVQTARGRATPPLNPPTNKTTSVKQDTKLSTPVGQVATPKQQKAVITEQLKEGKPEPGQIKTLDENQQIVNTPAPTAQDKADTADLPIKAKAEAIPKEIPDASNIPEAKAIKVSNTVGKFDRKTEAIGLIMYDKAKSQQGKVKYGFGVKNSKKGSIDCSGHVAEQTINSAKALGIETSRLKRVMNQGAAWQIDSLGKINGLQTFKAGKLPAENLKPGDIIGIRRTSVPKWAKGRPRSVSHIVQVVQGPKGKLFVSESAGSKKGVALTPLNKWLGDQKTGTTLYHTSPFNKIGAGQVSDAKIPTSTKSLIKSLPVNKQTTASTIASASSAVKGVDPGDLIAIATVESNLNPNVKSKSSSATGLFQFTKGTWAQMVKAHGKKHGIKIGDIRDPRANATMAAIFTKENQRQLTKVLGRKPNLRETYLAHFSGVGRAKQVLRAIKQNPNQPASNIYTAREIRANKGIIRGSILSTFNRLTNKVVKARGKKK